MAQVVPRVALADLQLNVSGMVSPIFATASEKLAVGLSRSRVVVVSLPPAQAAALKAGLQALLASGTRSLPGCDVHEWRAGEPATATIEEAYGVMDGTARLVLSALCRSSLLRLRSDAFSPMLDDLPLSRSAQGSSCLAAKAFIDNFSHLSAAETSAVCSNLFADPQEEASERGLVSVFHASEAWDPQAGALSAWQVKDSEGRWQGVALREGEVAVTLGHTMQHACTGLLQPGCHRVVGDPYAGSGGFGGPHTRSNSDSDSNSSTAGTRRQRQQQPTQGRTQLCFELRPRPAAVLDLRPQLEAAGHTVSSRFSPMSVSCLMEQFESLLSPSKLATPDQQQGAAAHSAWEELQASLKSNKKRTSMAAELAAADRPVTRSGNVRRSAEGMVCQQRPSGRNRLASGAGGASGQQEDGGEMEWEDGPAAGTRRRSSGGGRPGSIGGSGGGPASLGGGGQRRRDSLEPPSSALYLVRGRTCTVVGSCLQDDPADCLAVCVRSFTGLERWFYCNATTRCGAIFEMYCARLGISLGAVKFLLRGERVFGATTPEDLEMRDGEELTAVPDSSDQRQQARELGPLYAAVFGKQAAAAAAGVDSLAQMLRR
ncbi:hypothetical protein CHLNCDRAFT_58458 [Chlorella variabilis]|uniref:Ubiquitin-like domain-containing protein n=1 Tax=Chlorella variabilis TaxID=554065 RepID=E1ZKD7_CHLVA|nr:hypothetical protein CHLNCDRAFT_58458 [Chlorella variabilis]EFN53789.1 hypothetical protein CHLNCDRAFT_58458 [Chlorella variabilis]|eukprot:XP_005845891.1 hypothetical protein CHLNCDRAFT_58458 [Chlorella variabilis]